MPHSSIPDKSYRILSELDLVLMKLVGDYSPTDILEYVRAVSLDNNYECHFNAIVDIRRANYEFSIFDAKTIIALSDHIKEGTQTKTAIVSKGFLGTKMINFIDAVSNSGSRRKGFSTLDEACSWLDVSPVESDIARFFEEGI